MIYKDNIMAVGNTPLIQIRNELGINLYVKYEGINPTGSVKDRAANYVLQKLIQNREIDKNTTIIESSSGNFGISLATYCKSMNIKNTIVIDPNILSINEFIIRSLAGNVVKVTQRDKTGGYLLTRIQYIKEVMASDDNYYWINQYSNPYIAEAYYKTLGKEICDDIGIDYMFLGVSSGGTITGVSNCVKDKYPNAKIIAVDTKGSIIFGGEPKKRYIPGIGSSMRPTILSGAKIDEYSLIDEADVIQVCKDFLAHHGMLIGGSSGSVTCAIQKYFSNKKFNNRPNVVTVFADRGDRYCNTIYNDDWVRDRFGRSL